jgi:hypothetical protein
LFCVANLALSEEQDEAASGSFAASGNNEKQWISMTRTMTRNNPRARRQAGAATR